MINLDEQENIVEFEIPTFKETETCVVTEFSECENICSFEIPSFMENKQYVHNSCGRI